MATPLRDIVNDIIVSLKQTIDDREIQPAQVAFWVITLSNRLLAQHIQKRDSGAYLTIWPQVPVYEPMATQQTAIVAGRKHIELPASIFDFDKDGGIEYISYESDGGPGCPPQFTKVVFERTSPAQTRMLIWSPYTKPSPARPYFFRTGDYVDFIGIENVNVPCVEIGIYSTIKPVRDIDLDAPFTFPEELMDLLRRQCLDLGRFILMVPSLRQNIGDDPTGSENDTMPTQKVASVNQQTTTDQ